MITKFKYIINSLLFFALISSCSEKNRFEIKTDTITANIEGDIAPTVKYNNKYYCFFKPHLITMPAWTHGFYILSESGVIENRIKIPREINADFYDLFVKNDSIILKEELNADCYYLDTTRFKWIKINDVDDLIYEDEKFYVTYLNFKKIGATVWFKDKQTGLEYELAASTPDINRLNGVYYVTNYNKVFEITNPLDLKMCDSGHYYKNVLQKGIIYVSSHTQGTKIIFADSVEERTEENIFYIATSFISENQLYHLCVDTEGSYIAIIDKGKLKPVQKIGNKIFAHRHFYAHRNRIQNNSQLLYFFSNDENAIGFIEIINGNIFIRYIKQYPEQLQYVGTEKADSIFSNIFEFTTSNMENLRLQAIDSIEQEYTTIEKILYKFVNTIDTSLYPNTNMLEFEAMREYVTMDNIAVQSVRDYLYTKENDVKVVLFSWHPSQNTLFAQPLVFENQFDKIKIYITGKFGEPDVINENSLIWKTKNGLTIKLNNNMSRYYPVQIIIYKQ